jgi:hypothetical protein
MLLNIGSIESPPRPRDTARRKRAWASVTTAQPRAAGHASACPSCHSRPSGCEHELYASGATRAVLGESAICFCLSFRHGGTLDDHIHITPDLHIHIRSKSHGPPSPKNTGIRGLLQPHQLGQPKAFSFSISRRSVAIPTEPLIEHQAARLQTLKRAALGRPNSGSRPRCGRSVSRRDRRGARHRSCDHRAVVFDRRPNIPDERFRL